MTPIEYTKELWENQNARIKELTEDLTRISKSYLRLREMIPGAFNTPNAPTIDQVYRTTETALEKFIRSNIHE